MRKGFLISNLAIAATIGGRSEREGCQSVTDKVIDFCFQHFGKLGHRIRLKGNAIGPRSRSDSDPVFPISFTTSAIAKLGLLADRISELHPGCLASIDARFELWSRSAVKEQLPKHHTASFQRFRVENPAFVKKHNFKFTQCFFRVINGLEDSDPMRRIQAVNQLRTPPQIGLAHHGAARESFPSRSFFDDNSQWLN